MMIFEHRDLNTGGCYQKGYQAMTGSAFRRQDLQQPFSNDGLFEHQYQGNIPRDGLDTSVKYNQCFTCNSYW